MNIRDGSGMGEMTDGSARSIEELLEKPYWIIDLLPEVVPEKN